MLDVEEIVDCYLDTSPEAIAPGLRRRLGVSLRPNL